MAMVSNIWRTSRFLAVAGLVLTGASELLAQRGAAVSGRVAVSARGGKPASDVGNALVWLATDGPIRMRPDTTEILMVGKEFRPRVTVMPVGSVVRFPNRDPFNHNAFSVSAEGQFDLGLYGRGRSKDVTLERAGIVRVYCNVHARMSSFTVVRDNPYFAQPAGDGTFVIQNVPPGRYTLHAWHERAQEYSLEVEVTDTGVTGLDIQLDASGYRYAQHKNKYGRPYSRRGRRY